MGGQSLEPDVEVDQQRLDRPVRALARRVDDPVRQPRIEYDGLSVVVVEPRSGNELDRERAASDIVDAYLMTDTPVTLAVEPVVAELAAEEVEVFAATEAEDAIARPLTLVGSAQIKVSPRQIAGTLSYRANDGEMQPQIDVPVMRGGLLAAPLAEVGRPAVDATFNVSSGTPRVVKSRWGKGVDDESLRLGMIDALASPTRTARLDLERIEPERPPRPGNSASGR